MTSTKGNSWELIGSSEEIPVKIFEEVFKEFSGNMPGRFY